MRNLYDWPSLQAAANRLGIVPVAKLASVKELKEELAEKTDRAEAIKNLVAAADGEWGDNAAGRLGPAGGDY